MIRIINIKEDNPNSDYAMYLLDVVSRFTMREGGKVTGEAAKPFVLWGKVLERMI